MRNRFFLIDEDDRDVIKENETAYQWLLFAFILALNRERNVS